jgi:hypothetical protein
LPTPRAAELAGKLGLAGKPGDGLRTAAAWCAKYRALHAKHHEECRRHFAAALPAGATAAARGAFDAAAHLMQHEAGSGVLVSADAVLTCAHCVCADDDPDDEASDAAGGDVCRVGRMKLLLLGCGAIAVGECIACDNAADLALLRIVAHAGGDGAGEAAPRHAGLRCGAASNDRARVVCIGNPSEFNLESSTKGARIRFAPPIFHSSEGALIGRTRPEVLERNACVGPWEHTAWTYWGHSGAPLVNREGLIVGLHNSWDDSTGSRHCVGPDALAVFLAEALPPAAPAVSTILAGPTVESASAPAAAVKKRKRRELGAGISARD